jgi:hypothetical protein
VHALAFDLLRKQLRFAGHCMRLLLKATEREDGLVTSDEEVRKRMLDREAWRSRIKMIVAVDKKVDSSKREESEISFF